MGYRRKGEEGSRLVIDGKVEMEWKSGRPEFTFIVLNTINLWIVI